MERLKINIIILALALLYFTATIYSQTHFSGEKIITQNDVDRPTSVYSADLDGDGDMDVLSTSQEENKIAWYENDGTGTFGSQQVKQFKKLEFNKENDAYLNCRPITNIWVDREDNLWFSIPDVGLCKYENINQKLTIYNHKLTDPNSIISNDISDIIEDNNGNLWIGTSEGLEKFNLKSEKFRHFRIEASKNDAKNKISCLLFDSKGIIWLGTNGYGLYQFIPEEKRFESFENASDLPQDFNRGIITEIYEDSYGKILIGTNNGLYIYDPPSNKIRISNITSSEGKILSDYEVTFIQQSTKESNHIYWIGTTGGLHHLDLEKDIIDSYTTSDGMGGNRVCGILNDFDDYHDYLWISTDDGISRFNLVYKFFTNFTTYDGLQAGNFIPGSCCIYRDQLYFGGTSGLNFFSPSEVRVDPTLLSVYLAEIKINGKEFYSGSSPNNNKTFTLPRNSSNIAFTFGVLNSTSPRVSYAHLLTRNDFTLGKSKPHDWSYSKYDRTVIFKDMKGGEYSLLVKAGNRHGIWNEDAVLFTIIKQKKLWESIWFWDILLVAISHVIIAICTQKIALNTGHDKSWYAWIPIMNYYLLCQIANRVNWFWLLFTPIGFILFAILMYRVAKVLNKPGWIGILVASPLGLIFLPILAFSKTKTLDK